jgi:hypothetical protein
MTRYLLSVYQPDNPIPEGVDLDEIMRDVGAMNEELKEKGAWVFAGGLHEPGTSTVLRAQGDEVLTTDGPYVEGKEFLGGFNIIQAADLDEALEWGRKLARATRLPVEVRPFQAEG